MPYASRSFYEKMLQLKKIPERWCLAAGVACHDKEFFTSH